LQGVTPPEDTKLEAETRKIIDQKLIAAGWAIQDKKRISLYESLGVAVREMDTSPADYILRDEQNLQHLPTEL